MSYIKVYKMTIRNVFKETNFINNNYFNGKTINEFSNTFNWFSMKSRISFFLWFKICAISLSSVPILYADLSIFSQSSLNLLKIDTFGLFVTGQATSAAFLNINSEVWWRQARYYKSRPIFSSNNVHAPLTRPEELFINTLLLDYKLFKFLTQLIFQLKIRKNN